MTKRVGRQTVAFSKPIVIRAAASTVGKKEGKAPLENILTKLQRTL